MKSDIFNELNKQQKKAVEHTLGPSIILAGAGSGKTRVLTHKVLHLIQKKGVLPNNILMVTFTNKAASEMRHRVGQTLGFVGTFHSLCVKILRVEAPVLGIDPNFLIYDSEDQQEIIKLLIKEGNIPDRYTPSFFLHKISQAKDQLIDPEKYASLFSDYSSEIVAAVYDAYQKRLHKNNALDFDDLIFYATKLLLEKKDILEHYQAHYAHILVDEFQDTNFAQYMLTKLLAQKNGNLTVVGDFSQSIYSWRGAEIRNLEKIQNDFPNTVVFHLEQNYRSTQNILNFAYDIISKNQGHPVLKLFTDNDSGENVDIKQLENEQNEALFIAAEIEKIVSKSQDYSSIAILYRINAQSRVIEEAFLHYGIPYVLIGGTRFYERREVKDILSYLRLIVNPQDEISLKRAMKIGKRRYEAFKKLSEEIQTTSNKLETVEFIDKILQKTDYIKMYDELDEDDVGRLENIKELRSVAISHPDLTGFLEQVALVESEYSESEKKQKNKRGVNMMTLHQAKGLEFPYVFIVGVEEGILPHSRSIYDFARLEEERRLFYVGITRARKKLYITHAERRFFFGRRTSNQPSRFIDSEGFYESPSYY